MHILNLSSTKGNKMKLVLWAPFGAGEHYWGPGTSAYRLYIKFPKKISVTLVHSFKNQKTYPDIFDKQVYIPGLESKSLLYKFIFLIRSHLWLYRNRHEYDVVHGLTGFEFTFRPLWFAAKFLRKRVFIKLTTVYDGFGKNSQLSRLLGLPRIRRFQANTITGYIAISTEVVKNLRLNGVKTDRIHYIPNGVNTEVFFPVNNELRTIMKQQYLQTDQFTFLFVGGISHRKRVMEIIQAFCSLLKVYPSINLVIVGPDRSNDQLVKKIKIYIDTHQRQNNFFYFEHTNKPRDFYQIADAFILPSKSEGLSNSLLEAMASKLPVIVTPISGSNDLVQERITGIHTDGTISDLKTKMKFIYENQTIAEKLAANALGTIKDKFDTEIIVKSHLNLFFGI